MHTGIYTLTCTIIQTGIYVHVHILISTVMKLKRLFLQFQLTTSNNFLAVFPYTNKLVVIML